MVVPEDLSQHKQQLNGATVVGDCELNVSERENRREIKGEGESEGGEKEEEKHTEVGRRKGRNPRNTPTASVNCGSDARNSSPISTTPPIGPNYTSICT